jgi:hypothetical protein
VSAPPQTVPTLAGPAEAAEAMVLAWLVENCGRVGDTVFLCVDR